MVGIREKHLPDSWLTLNTYSMLGEALLAQEKHSEAEPLLLKGYRGLKAREATIPTPGRIRLEYALKRLVSLYEALDDKEQATKWRTELEQCQANDKSSTPG